MTEKEFDHEVEKFIRERTRSPRMQREFMKWCQDLEKVLEAAFKQFSSEDPPPKE